MDGKKSRVHEQYLTRILKELRRSKSGDIQSETFVYTQGMRSLTTPYAIGSDKTRLFTVLEELKSELAPINTRCVVRGSSSNKKDSSKLDNSRKRVRHREAEQKRRTTIRHLQDQISVFFLVQGQNEISVGTLLLFGKSTNSGSEAAVYLPNCFSYHLSKDRQSCLPRAHPPSFSRPQTVELDSCIHYTY